MRTARFGPIPVIDDELSITVALSRVLVAEGFQVSTFSSCSDFLEQGLGVQWACVLVDVLMPPPNGLDLLTSLGSHRTFPLITFSGADTHELGAQAVSMGAAAHLRKPIDVTDLVDCIRRAQSQA